MILAHLLGHRQREEPVLRRVHLLRPESLVDDVRRAVQLAQRNPVRELAADGGVDVADVELVLGQSLPRELREVAAAFQVRAAFELGCGHVGAVARHQPAHVVVFQSAAVADNEPVPSPLLPQNIILKSAVGTRGPTVHRVVCEVTATSGCAGAIKQKTDGAALTAAHNGLDLGALDAGLERG